MASEFNSQLFNIINSSSTYNFVDTPVPTFFLLYAKKKGIVLFFDRENRKVEVTGIELLDEVSSTMLKLLEENYMSDILKNFDMFETLWNMISAYKTFTDEYTQIVRDLVEYYSTMLNAPILSSHFASLTETCLTAFYNHYADNAEEGIDNKSSKWVDFYHFVDCNTYSESQVHSCNILGLFLKDVNEGKLETEDFKSWNSNWLNLSSRKVEDAYISSFNMDRVYDYYINFFKRFEETGIFCFPKNVCDKEEFKSMLSEWIDENLFDFSITIPALNKNGDDFVLIGLSSKGADLFDMKPFFFGEKLLNISGNLDWNLLEKNIFYYNYFPKLNGEELAPYFRPDLVTIYDEPCLEEDKDIITDIYFEPSISKFKPVKLRDIFEVVTPQKAGYCSNHITGYHFTDDPVLLQRNYKAVNLESYPNVKHYDGPALILTILHNNIQMCKWDSDQPFDTNEKNLVLRIKKNSPISLDYAAQALLKSHDFNWNVGPNISRYENEEDDENKYNWNNFLEIQIDIDYDKREQDEVVNNLRREYAQLRQKELESEMNRLGFRSASSDIMHMLGPTFVKIESTIYDLKLESLSTQGIQAIEALDDNLKYMKRFIQIAGADIMEVRMSFKENQINKLLSNIQKSWLNLSLSNIFDLQYESGITDDVTCKIDINYFRILFDTLFDNAYRHGFGKKKMKGNQVNISSQLVSMDNKGYVLLTVANNGKPLAEDFTLQKFISRGVYCGETGRTGLGGNHIYSILKRHNGFLFVTQNKQWNCIVEMLIPIEFQNDVELINMKKYEHIKECL